MEGEKLEKDIQSLLETKPFEEAGIRFLAMGADKAVFETTGSQKKLIKVNINTLKEKVVLLLSNQVQSTEDVHSLQKKNLEEYQKYEDTVALIFGQEHILKHGVFRTKIPLTKDFLLSFVDKNMKPLVELLPDGIVQEVEMIAETQIKAPEIMYPEKFSKIDLSTALMIHDDFYNSKNIDIALAKVREVVDNNFLSKFKEILKDGKYFPIIKELVSKMITYVKSTGLMLDIFGPNNITIFIKEDGTADYHLVDFLLPGPQEEWGKNIKDDEKKYMLRHAYTFYYSINSLGNLLGIEDNLSPDDMAYFKGVGIPSGKFPNSKSGI
jgi:hypothetical protein